MFCQNCSAFDTDDAKFCSRCGESLTEVPKKERILHLRIWKRRAFLQGIKLVRILFDFSFHLSSSRMIGYLNRLSILSAALFALLFVVMSFQTSQQFGLFTLLMIASLIFLFMVMCSRVILELLTVILRMENHKPPLAKKMGSGDPIEWNIE